MLGLEIGGKTTREKKKGGESDDLSVSARRTREIPCTSLMIRALPAIQSREVLVERIHVSAARPDSLWRGLKSSWIPAGGARFPSRAKYVARLLVACGLSKLAVFPSVTRSLRDKSAEHDITQF